MSIETESATSNPAQADATTSNPRSVWASPGPVAKKSELELMFDAARARNWITERMVQQYQKHWHCTREEALQRLLAKTGN